jgi:hypothetical protein
MTAPILTRIRDTRPFMRSTALTVLVAFIMLILQPTVAAAKTTTPKASTPKAPAATAPSDDQRFSQTLQHIEAKLQRIQEKLGKQQDSASDRRELLQLQHSLKQLDVIERQSFNNIEQQLIDHRLPSEILARHQDMVDHYQAEYDALMAELDAISAANNDADRLTRVQTALEHLKAKPNKKKPQPFDPNQLPNQTLKADPKNKPKETAEQFTHAGHFDTPYPQLAALGDFTFDKLTGATNPAYLAESDEVKLTSAIQAKAAELNHDPVKIYHWVRNNIVWQPTWGGIQNADLTLSAQRGNAMDIAGLTIALLRAAKIPARYVHGTIDVPSDAFKNWAGGFTSIQAAAEYAASGGIPVTSIVSGGVISKVRLEHVWVEAAIDFHPSRGAKNKAADSWASLDASYKQYEHKKGLDAVAISGIDPEQLAQAFIASGTVNEAESWATGFNAQLLKDAQTQAQQKLQTYIETQMQTPTVGDVIGGAKTIIQAFPMLPSGMPNRIVATGARYDKLPASLQQHIRYSFGKDIEGNLIDPVDFAFAKVNNAKITLSFKPATEADEQTLASLLPQGLLDISQYTGNIPSYLIKVVPELKLNGQTIKTGSTMKLGEELPFITSVSFAGRGAVQAPRTYNVIAGSYLAANVYAGNVSPALLHSVKTKLEETKSKAESEDPTQISSLTREDVIGDLYYAGSLGYFGQNLAILRTIELQNGGYYQLGSGTGTVGYEPKVSYFFGIPKAIEPGGMVFDIPLFNIEGVNDGDPIKKKQFALQAGILSSALEHAVPEQMYLDSQNPGEAISAVKALQKANAAGQRIYQITPANQSTTLSNIHHDNDTMTEIRNALNAGKEVITHTDAVSVPGWSGAGYIITDPDTGAGAYKIAGGANGGTIEGQPTNSPSYGTILMVGFTELVADNPLLSARLLGAAGFAGAVVGGIMLFILLVVVVSYIVNSIQQIEEEYKEKILNWAATNIVAKDWPGDNCKISSVSATRVVGWLYCGYSCRYPGNWSVARYIPSEFGCPTPVPCVPGVINAEPRTPLIDVPDPAVFTCVFR